MSPDRTRTVTAVPAIRPPRWKGLSNARADEALHVVAQDRRRETFERLEHPVRHRRRRRVAALADRIGSRSSKPLDLKDRRRRQRVADHRLVDLLQVAVLAMEEDEGVEPLQQVAVAAAARRRCTSCAAEC